MPYCTATSMLKGTEALVGLFQIIHRQESSK